MRPLRTSSRPTDNFRFINNGTPRRQEMQSLLAGAILQGAAVRMPVLFTQLQRPRAIIVSKRGRAEMHIAAKAICETGAANAPCWRGLYERYESNLSSYQQSFLYSPRSNNTRARTFFLFSLLGPWMSASNRYGQELHS
jgi:hypothetical protein